MLDVGLLSTTIMSWTTTRAWNALLTDLTGCEQPPKSSESKRSRLPVAESTLRSAATKTLAIQEHPYLFTGRRTPTSRALLRPAISIKLIDRSGDILAGARALIDSGADYITFSTDWAKLLGIDIHIDCAPATASVADGRVSKRYVYTDGLEIEVADERLLLPVVMFCEDLPIALLGRHDFFERYLVLLDQPNLRFFLERLPDTDDSDDEDDSGEDVERGSTLALD
jgi:hypothetical protein